VTEIDHRQLTPYPESMGTTELVEQLLALPIAERVEVAQALWHSIDEGLSSEQHPDGVIDTASRRDAELTSGAVASRSHEEVMQAARRAIGCE